MAERKQIWLCNQCKWIYREKTDRCKDCGQPTNAADSALQDVFLMAGFKEKHTDAGADTAIDTAAMAAFLDGLIERAEEEERKMQERKAAKARAEKERQKLLAAEAAVHGTSAERRSGSPAEGSTSSSAQDELLRRREEQRRQMEQLREERRRQRQAEQEALRRKAQEEREQILGIAEEKPKPDRKNVLPQPYREELFPSSDTGDERDPDEVMRILEKLNLRKKERN